jgi:hypothetical protein
MKKTTALISISLAAAIGMQSLTPVESKNLNKKVSAKNKYFKQLTTSPTFADITKDPPPGSGKKTLILKQLVADIPPPGSGKKTQLCPVDPPSGTGKKVSLS